MNRRWWLAPVSGLALLAGCAVDSDAEPALTMNVDTEVDHEEQGTRFDPNQPLAICAAVEPVYEKWSEVEACESAAPDRYSIALNALAAAGVPCTSRDRRTGECLALNESAATETMERAALSCTLDPDGWCEGSSGGQWCDAICCVKIPLLPLVCWEDQIRL